MADNTVLWIIAAVPAMALIAVIMYRLGRRSSGGKTEENAARTISKERPDIPPSARPPAMRPSQIELSRELPEPPIVPAQTTQATDISPRPVLDRYVTKELFKSRYENMILRLYVPSRAELVEKVINVFSLQDVKISHYCWKTDNALNTFPKWESIEEYLDDEEFFTHYEPGDENNIYKLTIPFSKVQSFTVEDNGNRTIIRHDSFNGQISEIVLLGRASAMLRRMIPEKEIAFVKRQKYLKSFQNIKDMKSEISQLRSLLDSGEISKEAYNIKKIDVVLRL